MARSVRYHPNFDEDVVSAANWYDERHAGLGADFSVRVFHATEQLIADPERRNAIQYGLRYWPIARFPYVVFYDLTDSEVIVVGVMHTSQNPDKWLSRRG